jgi:raffinose/stachyose/melibiose transport system permease protein
VLITVTSVALILLCCSMCAWFITRVQRQPQQIPVPSVCVFHGGALPDADVHPVLHRGPLKLNTPLQHLHHLPGLRRGAFGVHVLRLCEIHPPGDRGGRHDRRLQPHPDLLQGGVPHHEAHHISVGVLETMWIWNDYLLPIWCWTSPST